MFNFQFAWKQRMLADAAVHKLYTTGEVHAKYIRAKMAGNISFDTLLE